MVTSLYDGAAASSAAGNNEWHTVGMLCHRDTVWLHNPAYAPPSDPSRPQRLSMVPGMSNVTRLLDSTGFGTVNHCYIQGPSVSTSDSMQCIGQSTQWVDNVSRAPLARHLYTAGYFQPDQAPSATRLLSAPAVVEREGELRTGAQRHRDKAGHIKSKAFIAWYKSNNTLFSTSLTIVLLYCLPPISLDSWLGLWASAQSDCIVGIAI
jgi:hypothetical protein